MILQNIRKRVWLSFSIILFPQISPQNVFLHISIYKKKFIFKHSRVKQTMGLSKLQVIFYCLQKY